MNPFVYVRAEGLSEACAAQAGEGGSKFISGGTNLVDLMKEHVERPTQLVDITRLELTQIEPLPNGGLRLGALVTNAQAAYHPLVAARYPLLAQAILAGASPQIRNMATIGGNLLQRTRCPYFYDLATACNKREPESGCAALHGFNRMHAILGASDHCIAVHPSDMCVALAALEADVQVAGPEGARTIPFAELHRLPGDAPEQDTTLGASEVITAVDLPPNRFSGHSAYLKIRDRTSFAFALISVAAALELEGRTIRVARIALGGAAHKPWRRADAELTLAGRPAEADSWKRGATALLEGARGRGFNDFKISLARRAIVHALALAAGGTAT